jgi:HEAT repeats
MARKRRLFGPLFYSTAVLAIVAVLYACWLKLNERLSEATTINPKPNVESELAGALSLLSRDAFNERHAGVASLANLLAKTGPGDFSAGQHAQIAAALASALKDPDSNVRALAASGLANFVGSARQASAALSAALTDDDPDVRYNAAGALLRVGDELTAPALAALSSLVIGEEQPAQADRARILNSMAAAGPAGIDAALAALKQLFASRDPGIRRVAVMCALQLDPSIVDRARSDVELRLQDKDPEVRCAAAVTLLQCPGSAPGAPAGSGGGSGMMAMPGAAGGMSPMGMAMILGRFYPSSSSSPSPAAKQYPQALEALEQAVADASLPLVLRSEAVSALQVHAAGSLRKCGLELARQLRDPERQVRLDAARLLHMIEEEALAGPVDEEPGNDEP